MPSFFGKKQVDEPFEKQRKDLANEQEPLRSRALAGLDCDELPNATGAFGHSLTNPIPVNGIHGEFKYLNHLRCECGIGLAFHRLGSYPVQGIEGRVDAYETVCLNGKHWDIFHFHFYHPRRSLSTPSGYHFANFDPLFSTLSAALGTNQTIPDFPFGLAPYLEAQFGPVAPALISSYEKFVNNRSKFVRPRHHTELLSKYQKTSPSRDQRLDIIQEKIQAGEFHLAFRGLSALMLEEESDWNVFYLAGFVKRMMGDYREAADYYDKALVLNPDEASVYLGAGIIHQLLENYPKSVFLLRRAIQIDSEKINAYNSLGLSLKKAGNLEESLRAYGAGAEKLMDLAIREIMQPQNLGRFYRAEMTSQGRQLSITAAGDAAVQAFLRRDITFATLRNNMGFCHAELGNYRLAKEAFLEAIRFTPAGVQYDAPYQGLKMLDE